MRRALTIALATVFVAALVAPNTQAATRRYDFQVWPSGGGKVSVAVFYKNRQRHGRYTPRQAIYKASVPAFCNPPGGFDFIVSGSYILGTPDYKRIKLRKGRFAYSYSSEIPVSSGPPGSISATAKGEVIKKRSGVNKQLRVIGSVSILDYDNPAANPPRKCATDGPVSYSATPCRQQILDLPYIKKSLPLCTWRLGAE
ncbi:MAG: hypothetical protein ACXWDP_05650 [Solirubrobacterales bacterium]